ncbi:MAG: hypothetical protein U0704_02150 [Candidatus Eisenbacteria bacterium]
MKARFVSSWVVGCVAVMMVTAAIAAPGAPGASATGAAPSAAAPAGVPKLKNVTLHIFNRVFPSFHDKVVAQRGVEFRVGDSEYTARIVDYVPDFTLDLKTHKVTSRGTEPKNPAFKLIVKKGNVPQDTTWAFFNMPPHFARKSLIAFVATEINFTNRPALVSQDSLAIQIRKREGETH